MKVKAQELQYEMQKYKERMRGSKLSTWRIIPWFGLPQRRPYIHVVEALTKSIASGNQISSVNTITVTLIPIFTKKLLHKWWGSPRPPHKIVHTAPHQVGGSLTCRRVTKTPRMPAHRDLLVVHSRTTHKAATPCSLTHLRANLVLTLSKMC